MNADVEYILTHMCICAVFTVDCTLLVISIKKEKYELNKISYMG
jgi:hypothetical protein